MQVFGVARCVSVRADQAVLFFQDLAVAPAVEVGRAVLEVLVVHLHQADEAVSRHDVEFDVGKGLQVIYGISGSDQGEEEAELGDFNSLFHDVHAEQVLRDDRLFDVVVDARVLLLDVGQPFLEIRVAQEFDSANDGGVDVDERLHGRHEERGRTTGRVEQAQVR